MRSIQADRLDVAIKSKSHPITDAQSLDPLIEAIGDARIVMLGEASHGTHEYYKWRTIISRRLIEEKNFNFIAVEGDWPDCYEVNRYIKGWNYTAVHAKDVLQQFDRWPTWMWANWEIVQLSEWLKKHNSQLNENQKTGFYGLDMYSLWESLDALMTHLAAYHPDALANAERAMTCFEPFNREGQQYGWYTQLAGSDCEDEVINLLKDLRTQPIKYPDDPEAHFNAEQNAHVAIGGERYYRTMIQANDASWNVRDTHMADTLDRLLAYHGPSSKAIVWEHNTHMGDARYTDMADAGMINIGQLTRERYGERSVFLVGFGSHHGSVVAGNKWGAQMQKMSVPPARESSWEEVIYTANARDQMFLSEELRDVDEFQAPRGHRAIGVVYDPEFERYGNYVPTYLIRRYDAFLFFDETHALHPLHVSEHFTGEAPETYPWGF